MKKNTNVLIGVLIASTCSTATVHAALTEASVARAVSVFFKEAPVMVEVARCESGLRQFNEWGEVLRGGAGQGMIGLFQLHERYHRAEALTRGYNIDTLLGNMGYARELYREQGSTPWLSSAHCWERVQTAAAGEIVRTAEVPLAATATPRALLITKRLSFGMRDSEVGLLKQALSSAGYLAEQSPAGELYYDVATYRAVARLQCDRGIVCRSDGPHPRIGVVDTATRIVINSMLSAERRY
jgi:hypothetical protein